VIATFRTAGAVVVTDGAVYAVIRGVVEVVGIAVVLALTGAAGFVGTPGFVGAPSAPCLRAPITTLASGI
jgi:hypothetical protein